MLLTKTRKLLYNGRHRGSKQHTAKQVAPVEYQMIGTGTISLLDFGFV